MADPALEYTNSNRAFLQAFIGRSTLTFEEAKPLIAAISTAHGMTEIKRRSYTDGLQISGKRLPKTSLKLT